ncbi:hypothetical protein I317_01390 [Kwoniella heveanensis CBS 569]|nr:hypothetical protein I317_01390 [Kwoniella heveanensis CBS 569]
MDGVKFELLRAGVWSDFQWDTPQYRCYEVVWDYPRNVQHDMIIQELETEYVQLIMFRPYHQNGTDYLTFGKTGAWSETDKLKMKGILERMTVSYKFIEEYEDDNFRAP